MSIKDEVSKIVFHSVKSGKSLPPMNKPVLVTCKSYDSEYTGGYGIASWRMKDYSYDLNVIAGDKEISLAEVEWYTGKQEDILIEVFEYAYLPGIIYE